jgi:hypothetical protein
MDGRRLLAIVLSSALLAACGGSGSSGFDVAPGFEAPLIQRAIDEHRCVAGDDELLICASGVSVPDPVGGTPSPSPHELRVDAGLVGEVDCQQRACMVSVGVTIAGLPAGAEVRLAVRPAGDDAWHVGETLALSSAIDGEPTVAVAPVGAELVGGSRPGDQVQVAVLIFVPPLGEVPSEVVALHETGARYAFVLAPVALTPGASP